MKRSAQLVTTIAFSAWLAACGAVSSATKDTPTDDIVDAGDIGLVPEIISGPFDGIKEYCKAVRKKHRGAKCSNLVEGSLEERTEPYLSVEVVRVRHARDGIEYCEVAVETFDGWFVSDQLFICGEDSAKTNAELLNLELVPQKHGNHVLRIEVRYEEMTKKTSLTAEEVAFCGIGASGKVSCTAGFLRFEHVLLGPDEEEHRAVSMTFSRFGVLKLNGKTSIDGDIVDATGAYRLDFP